MTTTVYVHVGPHKSGTTFIQLVLAQNRAVLADSGVLFPGETYRRQREAVLDLIRGSRRNGGGGHTGHWDRLVRQVRDWRGDVAVISVENLDGAGPEVMKRIVHAFPGSDVHVIYTARDLTQVIPAMWHTRMRNRHSQSWQSYIDSIRSAPNTNRWPRHLRGQDPRRVLQTWEQLVPRERIHVVTVPPPGSPPQVLWERFCAVVGLKPDDFSLDVPRTNKSLGSAESELLRHLNERVAGRMTREGYDRLVQVFIARRVFEQRPGQLKFGLPAEDYPWVRAYGEKFIAFLRDRGYDVTGHLDELAAVDPDPGTVAPDAATDAQVLDAGLDALAGLLVAMDDRTLGLTPSPARVPGRIRSLAGSLKRRLLRRLSR